MNISSAYSLSGLAEVQANSLGKTLSTSSVGKTADKNSEMALSEQLVIHKSSLSQGLESMNSGIAVSIPLQEAGLAAQTGLLQNIKKEALNALNEVDSPEAKEDSKQEIEKNLDRFDTIAETTSYKGEKLLVTRGDVSDDLSISTDDTIIEMSKADTKGVSETLRGYLPYFSSNSSAIDNMLNDIDTGIDQLSVYSSEFETASNSFMANAKAKMNEESQALEEKSNRKRDIDYEKEVSEFSKDNLLNQLGHMIKTQANTVQERSVPLLS